MNNLTFPNLHNSEHYKKLERMYMFAKYNTFYSPKLTISEGHAELIIPMNSKFFNYLGELHVTVYFKALNDSALLAVNSLIKDFLIVPSSFTIYVEEPISKGEVRACGELVYSKLNLFYAKSILYDLDNREIAARFLDNVANRPLKKLRPASC